MAKIYRTAKVLIIDGVVHEPGTDITTAAATYMHLAAMLSANDIVQTQTDVVETNATSQFIPTTTELNWAELLPGPMPKRPGATINVDPDIYPENAALVGAGTLVALVVRRAVGTVAGAGVVVAVGTAQ